MPQDNKKEEKGLTFAERAEILRKEAEAEPPREPHPLAERLKKKPGYQNWVKRRWLRGKLDE